MKFLDKLIKGMLKYKIKLVIEKTFGGDLSRNKPESSFIYQINKTIYYRGYRFIEMDEEPFVFLRDLEHDLVDFLKELEKGIDRVRRN